MGPILTLFSRFSLPRYRRNRNSGRRSPAALRLARWAALAWLLVAAPGAVVEGAPAAGVEGAPLEGALHGFPAMRSLDGKKLADGDFAQWIEGGRLHIRILYEFGEGRRVEERAAFRQSPELVQEEWSLREMRGGELYRHFEVDFRSGAASAKKREEGGLREWTGKLETPSGRAFAGFGFTMALKALRERLMRGERVELRAAAFTPKPRLVEVELRHGGLDRMRMGGRLLRGDRFIVHAKIPWIATLFVDAPDHRIWLTNPAPAGFLRWEGPLAEPGDPVIRVDLLPGGESGAAEPIR